MSDFSTTTLSQAPAVTAPDGSEVRLLPGLAGGGMAVFNLSAGQTACAVAHRTVEEIWFVLSGQGELWRRHGEREQTVALQPGVCLTLPVGTHFQFRAAPLEALSVVAVTMPPWPGAEEAVFVQGPWEPGPGYRRRDPQLNRCLHGVKVSETGLADSATRNFV